MHHGGGFSHGIIFVTNLRISELFLIITRRIAENHGIIFVTILFLCHEFANLRIIPYNHTENR